MFNSLDSSPISILNTLQQEISQLLNLTQSSAIVDEEESLFIKNTCYVFL
jgi:hypothetical protein